MRKSSAIVKYSAEGVRSPARAMSQHHLLARRQGQAAVTKLHNKDNQPQVLRLHPVNRGFGLEQSSVVTQHAAGRHHQGLRGSVCHLPLLRLAHGRRIATNHSTNGPGQRESGRSTDDLTSRRTRAIRTTHRQLPPHNLGANLKERPQDHQPTPTHLPVKGEHPRLRLRRQAQVQIKTTSRKAATPTLNPHR